MNTRDDSYESDAAGQTADTDAGDVGRNFILDPVIHDALMDVLVPRLREAQCAGRTLRIWMLHCGHGDQAYSLAVALREAIDEHHTPLKLRIFATDPDPAKIAAARRGAYPCSLSSQVAPARLGRFFRPEGDRWRIRPEIRALLTFATHHLSVAPPFLNLDALICLNGVMNSSSVQRSILAPVLHRCLGSDGLLILGSGETLTEAAATSRFSAVNEQRTVYRPVPTADSSVRVDLALCTSAFPASPKTDRPDPRLKLLADASLLQHFSPPAVVVNRGGDILHLTGPAASFLHMPTGHAKWNIFSATGSELRQVLHNAVGKSKPVRATVPLPPADAQTSDVARSVQVMVQPLRSDGHDLSLIVFRELAGDGNAFGLHADVPEDVLRNELQGAHLEIFQLTRAMNELQEQLGTSNQELQSINEELSVTNDDLRSSNDQMLEVNDALLRSLADGEEAQRRVEALSHRLVSVQELERRRLSAELHDRTSANLAAMDVTLKSLAPKLSGALPPGAAHLLDDLTALLQDTTATIRVICSDLRPPILDHAGLLPALESYAQQFSERTDIEVSVTSDNPPAGLRPEHQSLLFRIAQEALTNCAKHAQASRVSIELTARDDDALLTIEDNGIGFAPDSLADPENPPGAGLLTMRERAEFAGGRFNVSSRPGEGTRITVEIACDCA